ncbi:hypothetical protein EX895_002185 [Sporisorium graminicola]|uniref:Uncharacterized protein n=1 Tax=Sporisorium graminicola TaxID=280036 RepID=A0A4U7KW49_9BASI|nr:hypothetical protein EX895_002185 [Sporisorium graminicola]TKY88944.1 hypothetical protein EX895_002185 [Sporisorium graminicola]
MEHALQSLTNTLDAINSRQAAARKRARKGLDATPFTSAVLNREGFEITTYIRDADIQTEANLFWYPPLPQSASASRAGPSSSNHRSAHIASTRSGGTDDPNEADLLLAPRLPEPRHVAPPTPLRNTNVSNKQTFQSQDDSGVDARVLLLAAQRLNDTCGKGSRTRKHIKAMLKQYATYNHDIKAYEQHIRQSEAQLRATAEGKPIAASQQLSSSDLDVSHGQTSRSAIDQLQANLATAQDRIQKEELEILALEEMIEELRQARSDWQRQELERQQRAQAQAEAARMLPREQTFQRAFPRASLAKAQQEDVTIQHETSHADTVAEGDDLVDSTVDVTQQTQDDEDQEQDQEQVHQLTYSSAHHGTVDQQDQHESVVETAHHDISVSQSFGDQADLTIQQPREQESNELIADIADTSAAIDPVPVAEETHVASPQKQPPHLLVNATQSSQELDRATQRVWEVFGDALRSVVPEREAADYFDTLDALKSLMSGGNAPNAGDYSVGSVQTSSTLSTSASEASAAVAAQLTPEVLMTAFVIFQMLVSEEPHRMNIDELKMRGHEWWSTSGMQVWLHAQSHDEHDVPGRVEAFEDGQNLARKATYGMISRQLFAIRRQKGVGLVGFA